MNILVTGGAGFIGSHLVDSLVERNHRVRILDALVSQVHGSAPSWPEWVNPGVERVQGDVRDLDATTRAVTGMDVVFHLAAEVGVGQSMYEIRRYIDANTMGTVNLLELLAGGKHGVRKLIVASSMSIYGEGAYRDELGRFAFPPVRPVEALAARRWELFVDHHRPLMPVATPETKPICPSSIYAISKRDQEEMCLVVGRAYGIPTVALRFFNVYGTRQALSNPYTGVAAIFASRLLNGKPPIIFEDGLQSRDFTHVSDIVQALMLAMDRDGADYQAVNVGTGRSVTVLHVAEELAVALGRSVEPEVVGQYRAGDIRHCFADITKARNLLGYEPRVTFEAGLRELVSWLRQQKAADRVDAATEELRTRGLVS